MPELYSDSDRYGGAPKFPLVEATLGGVQDLVRRQLAKADLPWGEFVFGPADTLIDAEALSEIERKILATGYRFAYSSNLSARDRPEIYLESDVGADEAGFSFSHPDAEAGEVDAQRRTTCGTGDNVVQLDCNRRGTALYVRTSEKVLQLMREGIPDGTIAIIDDAGGTLTAPILERFSGVICAGGTVRSHLGILTREFGIPCLMNAKISGIYNGDLVEIESSAPSPTIDSYQTQQKSRAHVWKLV